MAKKGNSREVILDAAEAVVAEMGAAHLSLDVVARKAGVSKGGLLYNFPSKRTLLKAMMERLIARHYEDRERELARLPSTAGRELKADILACLAPNERRDRIALSMLAAMFHEPALLEPLRKAYKIHTDALKAAKLPYERATVISLASDGLMFREMLGLALLTPGERVRVQKDMIALIDGMEAGRK